MTNPDFSIQDFLAWARTKPADEGYTYIDSSICALAQFGLATRREHLVGPGGSLALHVMPELRHALNCGEGYTYGELVARLERLCPQSPAPRSEWAAIGAYLTDLEMARS